MAAPNGKYEAAAASALRFWQGQRERYQQEGAAASDAAECPYPRTSFAAIHWRIGAATRIEIEA